MSNRKISFNDFFACLQREYLVAELRYKIYEKPKDKNYYLNKEILGKKKTIEEISSRNNYPNIFTDSWLRDRYKSEIYTEWGLPNFIYRSNEDRENRRPRDIVAYFHKGVEVLVKLNNGDIVDGIIFWTDLENRIVRVKVNAGLIEVSFDNLKRKDI